MVIATTIDQQSNIKDWEIDTNIKQYHFFTYIKTTNTNIPGKSFLGLLIKQTERHKFMDYAAVERMMEPTEAPQPGRWLGLHQW